MDPELAELVGSLKTYLDLSVEDLHTLDPSHYTSKALYQVEVEQLFKKEWICVGHGKELPNAGDFFSINLVGEPLIIIRGEDMNIRALSSVCRHRMMLVVRPGESGNTTELRCPYHRWTYALDGTLDKALYMEHTRCFNQKRIRLPEFRLEIWNDLIWVNLDDNAPPLGPKLSELNDTFSVFTQPNDGVMTNHYDKVWPGNWKCQVENNLEGYHHMGLHEATIEAYTPTRNTTNLTFGEGWTRHQVPYDLDRDITRELLKDVDWRPDDWPMQSRPELDVIHIHPGNSFVIYPGSAGYYTIWPTAHDQFRFRSATVRRAHAVELGRSDPNGTAYDTERPLDEDGESMPFIFMGASSQKAESGPKSWMEGSILRWYQWKAKRMAQADNTL